MNRRTLLIVVAGLVGIVGVAWSAMLLSRQPSAASKEDAGKRVTLRFYRDPLAAPPFTARDLDGRVVSSSDWRGKVTIVNFWATWCPPCREEIPDLVALQEKYRDRLQIIGISQDEGSPDKVRRFAADHKINYPIVMLTPEIEKLFPGVNALPTSFIVDREARIVKRHVGMLDATTTELETRALAGLDVNASIEEIDRTQPLKLENAAQVTSIPGIDLAPLSPDVRVAVLQKLNAEPCTCGCDLTVARCRVDDPACDVSLPLAKQIVQQIAEQR